MMTNEEVRQAVLRDFVPGELTKGRLKGRARCTVCDVHPEAPEVHVRSADHRLRVRIREMNERGWTTAGLAAQLIRGAPGVPWEKAPTAVGQNIGLAGWKETDDDFVLGTWAPRWAVQIGHVFGAPSRERRVWLAHTVVHGPGWFADHEDVLEATVRLAGGASDLAIRRDALAQVWRGLYKETRAALGLGQDG